MSLFDKLKNKATGAVGDAAKNIVSGTNKSVSVVFNSIPSTLGEFTSLPQAAMPTPFDTAAMVVLALGVYKADKNLSISMLNHLKGPQPLSNQEISFIADRMAQNGKIDFIAESYFNGATPQNNYTPTEPYTVVVSENPYSYQDQSYAVMWIKSGGADNPRQIKMRKAKDNKWYLWEHMLLGDIRPPESTNAWA
jgi:hypothetical protein